MRRKANAATLSARCARLSGKSCETQQECQAFRVEMLNTGMARPGKPWARPWIRLALTIFALAGVASGVWFFASREAGDSHKAQAAREQDHPQRAVPVLAAAATAKDFP